MVRISSDPKERQLVEQGLHMQLLKQYAGGRASDSWEWKQGPFLLYELECVQ